VIQSVTKEAENVLAGEDSVWGREVEGFVLSLILRDLTTVDLCNCRAHH
jgi:hypothetical protein